MNFLNLYKWLAGSKSDFTRPFQNDPNLFKRAQIFWNQLDSVSIGIIIISIFLGIIMAIIYYGPYNEKPGRHYKPTHWLCFLFITFVLTFILTYLYESIAVASNINGAETLELKIALCNSIYSSLIYFIISVVWCNSLPTNAYRLFKM